jgi:hypothetical protein
VRVYGKDACPSGIFDWQGTSAAAVAAYLRHDFAGMFELEDLRIEGGMVRNFRYGTWHLHQFPKGIGVEDIAAHYPEARSRHDHLSQKTLRLLRGRDRLLLCLNRHLSPVHWARLWLQLRLRYPQLSFILLNGPKGDFPADVRWEGDDALWDRHLAPFQPALRPVAGVLRSSPETA